MSTWVGSCKYRTATVLSLLVAPATILALVALSEDLYSGFSIEKKSLEQAYESGRNIIRKKLDPNKLIAPFMVQLGNVRSPSSERWQASYAQLRLPVVSALINGYNDAKEYKDSADFTAAMKALEENPPAKESRRIRLYVRLFAWPGISDWNGSINRAANPEDVRSAKFVILVDGDPDRAIHPIVKPTAESEATYDGKVSIPEYNTVYGRSSGSATASGPGGTAYGSYNSTSTVTYVTHTVESYSMYEASYNLEFPLFDKNGKPYFTSSSKNITLKVIRRNGEHTGKWEFPKLDKAIASL